MVFRATLTRAARGILCALLAVGIGWAIGRVITYGGVDALLRVIALAPLVVLEAALIVGLWRLWAVCLIVEDTGVIVRNFRGDIRLRRSEIGQVIPVMGLTGCHVALRLKIGDELHLDGLAFASGTRTNQEVQAINEALGLVSPRDEP